MFPVSSSARLINVKLVGLRQLLIRLSAVMLELDETFCHVLIGASLVSSNNKQVEFCGAGRTSHKFKINWSCIKPQSEQGNKEQLDRLKALRQVKMDLERFDLSNKCHLLALLLDHRQSALAEFQDLDCSNSDKAVEYLLLGCMWPINPLAEEEYTEWFGMNYWIVEMQTARVRDRLPVLQALSPVPLRTMAEPTTVEEQQGQEPIHKAFNLRLCEAKALTVGDCLAAYNGHTPVPQLP
ncbi:hypothetical protein C8R45DRAFT_938725 [Mycena sanguinolenta]|nr:hypothetical protein C8R45DRAFT_938725 [Mycena sanguinolenta]